MNIHSTIEEDNDISGAMATENSTHIKVNMNKLFAIDMKNSSRIESFDLKEI